MTRRAPISMRARLGLRAASIGRWLTLEPARLVFVAIACGFLLLFAPAFAAGAILTLELERIADCRH